ncbi:MAG: N-terminal phage integrase SAM-like domain-containing protein [Actinomycetota bacterium]|nr:N-terminal phage integrase SAM-like domain-containing protein [Actinomycetota bacterium]
MRGSVINNRCSRCTGRVSGRVCPRCETRDHINWGYVVELGTDPSGKRKQRLRSYGTRREAEEQLSEALTAPDDSDPLEPTRFEYLHGHWLSATQPPHVSWKTWNDRKQQLENHVLPRLGEVLLSDLKPTDLNLL